MGGTESLRRLSASVLGAVALGTAAVISALLLHGAAAVATPTCTINFNKVAGGDFFTVANWNDAVTPTTHRVPTTTDYACIPATTAGVVTFSTGASATVAGLDAQGTAGITFGSGTLTVTDTVNDSTIANVKIAGGTINGAANVTLVGSGIWNRGTIAGPGGATLATGATVAVMDNGNNAVLARSLTNHGTITVTNGGFSGLTVNASATLTNAADGVIDLQGDSANLSNSDASAVSLANSGVVKRSSGTGTTTIGIPITSALDGVQQGSGTGTVSLTAGGTFSGTATIPSGAILSFDTGSYALTNVTFAGAGTTRVAGATWQLNGVNAIGSPFVFSGGTIDGAGSLNLSGATTWNRGTMQGAGTVTVANGNTVALASKGAPAVVARPLTNHGTIAVTNGGFFGLTLNGGVTLTNAADGVIDLQGNSANLRNTDASAVSFANSGVVLRSTGAGSAAISIPITSALDGLQPAAGTLSLTGGGTLSGTATVPSGVTLSFDSGSYALTNATFSGAGTTSLSGATWLLTGSNAISSGFVFSGSTIDGTGSLALSGATTWNRGTMQGAGTVTIASGTTVAVTSTANSAVLARPMTNHGTITVTNGGFFGLTVNGGVTLTNAVDGVIDLQGNSANIRNSDASAVSFTNLGVINRSTGAGSATISIPITSALDGLQPAAGTLSLTAGGTLSGTATVPSGVTLSFDTGNFAVTGATFTGAGTTRLSGATLLLTGSNVMSGVFVFSGGTIDGAGSLTLSDSTTWNRGTMQGAGAVTVSNGANVAVTSSGNPVVLARSLTNHGTVTVTNGGFTGLVVNAAATVTNAADGLIDLQGDSANIRNLDASAVALANSGVVKRSSGVNGTTISIPMTNSPAGELRAETGVLSVPSLTNLSGSTLTGGTYTITATLRLTLGGNKIVTNAATITFAAAGSLLQDETATNAVRSIAVNSGTLVLAGGRSLATNAASFTNSGTVMVGDGLTGSTLTVAGPYVQTGGSTTVALSSTLTPTASTVSIQGGTLNGAGTVAGPVASVAPGAIQNDSTAGPLGLGGGYSGTGTVAAAITSATVFDQVAVTGTADVTGTTLALSTDPGYAPVHGQTFTIMTCSTSCAGPFASVTGAVMADGAFYQIGYTATSVTLTAVRNVDVSITNADSADPIAADAPSGPHTSITYTVTASNAGPAPANNVIVTDTLPHHAFLTSMPGSCSGTGDVKVCSLGTIASGGSIVLSFVVTPPTPETLVNTVSSTSTSPDPNGSNNTGVLQTTVVNAKAHTSYVNVDDGAGGVSYDQPAITLQKLGDALQFNFFGAASHRLLSNEGILDTGVHAPGSEFSAVVSSAGAYTYHDTLAAQVVNGSVTAKPALTGTGTTRTVKWATVAAPAGYVFDVKLKTPTGTTTFLTGTTTTSTVYTANQGPGRYQFQVRLRRTSDNKATGYAKSKVFTV